MTDRAYITVMMLDSDRFFQEGVVQVLKNQLPHTVVRHSAKLEGNVDLLIAGCDAVSLCAAQHFAARMSPDGQLITITDTAHQCWQSLPPLLQTFPQWMLSRRQSEAQLAALLRRVMPPDTRLIMMVDPRACSEERLTPREKTLIELLRVNATPHQIASCMALHPKTVSTYKRSVMHKLGMQKNLELYHWLLYS